MRVTKCPLRPLLKYKKWIGLGIFGVLTKVALVGILGITFI